MKCVVVGAIVAGLLGCGKSGPNKEEEQAAKDRASAAEKEKVITDGKALFAKAKALLGKLPASPVKKMPFGVANDDNAIFVSSDLAETEKALVGKDAYDGSWWPMGTGEYAVARVIAGAPGMNESAAPWLAKVKYLVVLTPVSYREPKMVSGGFVKGERVVELRVYELATGNYLGGQVVTGTNADVVTDHYNGDPVVLTNDLREKFSWAVTRAMRELTPGAFIGSPPGAAPPPVAEAPVAEPPGGDAAPAARPPGWTSLVGHGIMINTPAAWNLVPYNDKSPGHILSADHGSGDEMEIMEIYQEPDTTSFTTDAECSALVAGYAGELKSKVKTAKLDQGACVADLDQGGKHVQRLRYWVDKGKKYSILCDTPGSKAKGIVADCDRVWASRMIL